MSSLPELDVMTESELEFTAGTTEPESNVGTPDVTENGVESGEKVPVVPVERSGVEGSVPESVPESAVVSSTIPNLVPVADETPITTNSSPIPPPPKFADILNASPISPPQTGNSTVDLTPATNGNVATATENTDTNANTTITSIADDEEDSPKKKKNGPGGNTRFTRHLKKSDGEPFWRKDIQYDFLKALFDNDQKVFTNTFPDAGIVGITNEPKYSFSELYVRTLAESGKCSKILKERLLKDVEMGVSVGKVCLLVNSGRMNTTINFVPEMRSTLRTYHSIPSLQADPIHGGSKPLQDTPRLKLILKSVCEGQEHLKKLQDIMEAPLAPAQPNTNIIQLIFLLSTNSRGIKYYQEEGALNNNFMDFFLNEKVHPRSRALRFLWLMYTFLETGFSTEEIKNNPFGIDGNIPSEEMVPDEEVNRFDQDTEYEIKFSQEMILTRQRYLTDEEHNSNPKRGNKSRKDKELAAQVEDENVDVAAAIAAVEGVVPIAAPAVPTEHNPPHAPPITAPLSVMPVASLTNAEPESLDTELAKETSVVTSSHTVGPPGLQILAPAEKRGPEDDGDHHIAKKAKRPLPTFNSTVSSPLGHSVISAHDSNGNGATASKATNGLATLIILFDDEPSHDYLTETSTTRMERSDHNLTFPIKQLSKIKESLPEESEYSPTNKTSMASHLNIVSKSKPLLKQLRANSKILNAEFNKKVEDLKDWIFRYFQYKKSTSNGLLGMEWENMRYDVINGIESFVYKQQGKSYEGLQQEILDNTDNGRRGHNIGGVSGADLDEVGFGFVPVYDFNRDNEENKFIQNLLQYCNETLAASETESLKKDPPRNANYVSIDLKGGKIEFNLEF